jgi:hypothetical protein
MFTDKLTLAIAEAAKKCMDEELKGNQHKIDANKNGKIDADDFKKLRNKKEVSEELKGNQHKIDANKNGKIDAQDFKLLRKEDTVNEEEGQHGYVAFSHDGKRHELHANSSYEAKQKAVKHFNPPKSKQHLVTVHLAQKDGKDVVHRAVESVQEAAIDDLRDRQAAKREANPYDSKDKKEPVARKVQGSQYGGSKQKQEKEVEVNEAKMSDEDMQQREKIVNGMKKNLKGFKARYGDDAKKVMYATATKQAMKEEEQLDELSKDTLGSYVKKATADKDDSIKRYNTNDRDAQGNKVRDQDRSPARKAIDNLLDKRSNKRIAGLKVANAKLAKEEADNDQFKAELEDNKAKAAGTKKQPDVHKAAVQSVKQESFSEKLSTLKESVRSFLKGKNNG